MATEAAEDERRIGRAYFSLRDRRLGWTRGDDTVMDCGARRASRARGRSPRPITRARREHDADEKSERAELDARAAPDDTLGEGEDFRASIYEPSGPRATSGALKLARDRIDSHGR